MHLLVEAGLEEPTRGAMHLLVPGGCRLEVPCTSWRVTRQTQGVLNLLKLAQAIYEALERAQAPTRLEQSARPPS